MDEIRNTKTCEHCQEEKPINDFLGSKRIGPWCKLCRSINPHGAKLARDAFFQRQKTHEDNQRRYQERKQKNTTSSKRKRRPKELLRTAYQLSRDGIEIYKKQAILKLRQDGFTKGQIEKTLAWMDEISKMIGD